MNIEEYIAHAEKLVKKYTFLYFDKSDLSVMIRLTERMKKYKKIPYQEDLYFIDGNTFLMPHFNDDNLTTLDVYISDMAFARSCKNAKELEKTIGLYSELLNKSASEWLDYLLEIYGGFVTPHLFKIVNWYLDLMVKKTFDSDPTYVMERLVPLEDSFTMYKKVHRRSIDGIDFVIAKLEVPKSARRIQCNPVGGSYKIRVSSAKVVDFYSPNDPNTPLKFDKLTTDFVSMHDPMFKYVRGKSVKPTKKFDTNEYEQCSTGIHGFMKFEDAVGYMG